MDKGSLPESYAFLEAGQNQDRKVLSSTSHVLYGADRTLRLVTEAQFHQRNGSIIKLTRSCEGTDQQILNQCCSALIRKPADRQWAVRSGCHYFQRLRPLIV